MIDIIVCGDLIQDEYVFCESHRLCPEAPVPVLLPRSRKVTEGGAGLVANQIEALNLKVRRHFGSVSHKLRYFVDTHLITRVDEDSQSISADNVSLLASLEQNPKAIVIVSDYGKGAITAELAQHLVSLNRILLVDAKNDWRKYSGAWAYFPNEKEAEDLDPRHFQHVIRKLGPKGCQVDGVHVSTDPSAVRDVTGAGDCFLAGFAAHLYKHSLASLIDAAKYANRLAGESVKHVGTYVVPEI